MSVFLLNQAGSQVFILFHITDGEFFYNIFIKILE